MSRLIWKLGNSYMFWTFLGEKPCFKILVSVVGGLKIFFSSKLYTFLVEMVFFFFVTFWASYNFLKLMYEWVSVPWHFFFSKDKFTVANNGWQKGWDTWLWNSIFECLAKQCWFYFSNNFFYCVRIVWHCNPRIVLLGSTY